MPIDKSKITKEMMNKAAKFIFFPVALFDTPPVLE